MGTLKIKLISWCNKLKKHNIAWKFIFVILIFAGCFFRIYYLGKVPGGINQDEAFAGYEAWSMYKYGVDTQGYHMPVYLVTWGSGMNALNSYLMIPFIAIFGLHTWVIRIPQMIVGILSILALYKIVDLFYGFKPAVIVSGFLAICPWHIMLSRWGLESNLAPGFLIIALWFFILGVENSKWYMVSAVFYGLSLYCYATIWIVVPFIIALQCAYLLFIKKMKLDKWLVAATVILLLLALPLMLFVAINKGWINEIILPFMSIPKLVDGRMSEVSFSNIIANTKNLLGIIYKQSDGLYWNATEEFGLYYKGTLLFSILGGMITLKECWKSLKRKALSGYVFLMIQFVTAFVLGMLVHVNINRINCIHISIVVFTAIGLIKIVKLLAPELPCIKILFICCFLVLFVKFEHFYYTEYSKNIGVTFQSGLEEAVEFAEKLAGGYTHIYIWC